MRALVGLVLVFSVYLIYQQVQLMRLRHEVADQMQSLAKVETLASEVYKLAALDQLTGLYNRRSGEQRLAQEISRAQRHGRPLTVLLMDLDGLKQINDRHGHAAGDTVLKGFADRLQRAIRGSDLAVRLGGDEFMALLPECRSEEVRHVLGRLEGLEFEFDNEKMRLQYSCGWTDSCRLWNATGTLKRADTPSMRRTRRKRRVVATLQTPVAQSSIKPPVHFPAAGRGNFARGFVQGRVKTRVSQQKMFWARYNTRKIACAISRVTRKIRPS